MRFSLVVLTEIIFRDNATVLLLCSYLVYRLRRMARLLLAGLAYSFILATGVAQDAPDIISVDVASSNDLVIFMDNIKKDEKRVFNVTWYGRQQVGERITVSSGTNVTITGVTLPGADPAVANDAGIATGMFFVHGGSILSLRNLMLDGGDAEDGAAISVVENGVVNVFDCAFTNNIASNGGDTAHGYIVAIPM